MVIKNPTERKIASFFLCLFTFIFGCLFSYFTIKQYTKNVSIYLIILIFTYLEFIFIKNFIALNKKYQIENNALFNDKNEIQKENIRTIEITNNEKNGKKLVSIKINNKFLIECSRNPDLERYIKSVFVYKEKEFSTKEKNFLFNRKIVFFLIYFNLLVFSFLFPNVNLKKLTEFNISTYVSIFFIGYFFVKSIFIMYFYKNSYFNNEELYIKNKHIPYKEIISIEKKKNDRKGTEKLIINTSYKQIQISMIYLKYDSIVEYYIHQKIKQST